MMLGTQWNVSEFPRECLAVGKTLITTLSTSHEEVLIIRGTNLMQGGAGSWSQWVKTQKIKGPALLPFYSKCASFQLDHKAVDWAPVDPNSSWGRGKPHQAKACRGRRHWSKDNGPDKESENASKFRTSAHHKSIPDLPHGPDDTLPEPLGQDHIFFLISMRGWC